MSWLNRRRDIAHLQIGWRESQRSYDDVKVATSRNVAGVAAHTSWGGGEGGADILSPVLVPGLPPVSVFPPPDRRHSQWPPTKEPCYPLSRTPSPSLRTSSLEVFPRPSPRPPWRPSSVSSCCCKYNTSASRSPSKTATRVSSLQQLQLQQCIL